MSEQDNITLVQQAYNSFQTGDIPTLLNAFADDIEWITPEAEHLPFGGTYNGREEVEQFFAGLNENEEVQKFEPREFIAQGNKVIVLGLYAAKVKSTNRVYEMEWVHVFSIVDGKITNFHEYVDSYAGFTAYQKAMTA